MSKAEFIERIRESRTALNDAISGLTEDQMSQDLVTAEWTTRDILAHIAAWQGEATLAVERAARGEVVGPLISESVDEWNARRIAERRRLPLMDVVEEYHANYDRLLTALERWPDDSVPLGPAGWDATAELWWVTEHDGEHVEVVRAYRKRAQA
ncbi:MAG: hypothetical protein OJF49_001565 [Ktedonobacterales bacterium]|jgi:hypothetical protein|nr:MAG: hypothetical protein OJF49_001565 [Ktedonobacterales bacterium]